MDPATRTDPLQRGIDIAQPALKNIERMSDDVQTFVAERPYATIAATAVAAFAIGALWKLGHRKPSRIESLKSQLPELHDLTKYLPRQWR